MSDRHILICTTFREFDGGPNDVIQRAFLENIKAQTYKNFTLVVTNFYEKNVKKTLDEYSIPYIFYQSKRDLKLSFTEVVESAFPYIEKDKHILLWTNADNLIAYDFLETIIKNFETGDSGTYFPLHIYENMDDYQNNVPLYHPTKVNTNFRAEKHTKTKTIPDVYQTDPNYWVPDIVFVDANYFLDEKIRERFLRLRIDGSWPGYSQNICIGLMALNKNQRKNLFYQTKVSEILNIYTNKVGATKQEEQQEAQHDRWKTKGTSEAFANARQYATELGLPNEKCIGGLLYKVLLVQDYDVVGTQEEKDTYHLYCEYWKMRYEWETKKKEKELIKNPLGPNECLLETIQNEKATINHQIERWQSKYRDLIQKVIHLE